MNKDLERNRQNKFSNKNTSNVLPPEVEGNQYGHLFLEIGNLDWLIYEGTNYLEDDMGKGPAVQNLFANIKFWGDMSKGVYLKLANGMKKKEHVINKYQYSIKTPEKNFEKYLDDMGVLIVDFHDASKSVTIGTSKIPLKLYIKRYYKQVFQCDFREKDPLDDSPLLELRGKFNITSIGNQNLQIGEFSISLISSFSDPFNPKGLQKKEMIDLNDSFIQNEKIAEKQAQLEKNKTIINTAFSDNRIPSSLQGRTQDQAYQRNNFEDLGLDHRPTRDRQYQQRNQPKLMGKENQRNIINIDENEDTIQNNEEMQMILNRAENLKKQMSDVLDPSKAWETFHGPHAVQKEYMPPFLQKEEKKVEESVDSELEHLYVLEIEGDMKEEEKKEQEVSKGFSLGPSLENANLKDMKFIRMKVTTLRVENEELLHELMDETFNLTIDLPLPEIYQKKITYQQTKLNNYDVISFNEYVYNSMTLFNFKISEDTFNQLAQSSIKVQIEGKSVSGYLNMNRLLLAKGFKLEASIPLERVILIEKKETKLVKKETLKTQKGKKPDPKAKKQSAAQKAQQSDDSTQITRTVGHLGIELILQTGDAEQELKKNYDLQILKIKEAKEKEDEARQKETEKRMKFSQNQETLLAQLYLKIDQARNLILRQDGTLVLPQNPNQDTFNERQLLQTDYSGQQIEDIGVKRNLYICYKSFPSLEKLQTPAVFHSSQPKFNYSTQFPLRMEPAILEKLEKFTFVLEVWDQISPAKSELFGIVKIPLASFCYSMKTNDEEIFSTNFLADQHCLYPMIVSDDYLKIYSPKVGSNVGELKVTLALGTFSQITKQIQKENEQEQQFAMITMQQQITETIRQDKLQQSQLESKRQQEIEELRILKEEQIRIKQEEERPKTPEKLNSMFSENQLLGSMSKMIRQSISNSVARDFDLRKMNQLNCIRKLFEESRANHIHEINGDDLLHNVVKNLDGSVKKEDFINAILNRTEFTLTRTEIANICTLMLNISKDDNNNIDVDELQYSFSTYLKYYELIEQRISDLLEKFKLLIIKKVEVGEQMDELLSSIEGKTVESKIALQDLKEILENQGIMVRNTIYDQLASYFDLDKNDQIYMSSFCEYLRNSSMKDFNFFKVNPQIIGNHICEFLKNSVESNKDCLDVLEQEFKTGLYKSSSLETQIPPDFLVDERINAKYFQFKLKRQGIILSIWEVFVFFDYLNVQLAKMFYEPQRYHQITFPFFYRFITNQDYEAKVKHMETQLKASVDSAMALAQALNEEKQNEGKKIDVSIQLTSKHPSEKNPSDKKSSGQKKRDASGYSEGGLYSSKSELEDSSSESEVIVRKKTKKKKQIKSKEVTFQESEVEKVSDHRPYKKVKHIFDIKIRELKDIPILDKVVKDQRISDRALEFKSMTQGQTPRRRKTGEEVTDFINNVAVKYSFPLDEDEFQESDHIQYKLQKGDTSPSSKVSSSSIDFKVSMNSVHTYTLDKDEKIQKLLTQQINKHDDCFNVQIVLYSNNSEFVVGNAQLPIDDIIDIVNMYDNDGGEELQKRLFVYGTNFCQRENLIIGKVLFSIKYYTEKMFLNENVQIIEEEEDNKDSQTCFLHREVYINRKIPLNAVISVSILRISNIKESLDNIEHFAKITQSQFKEQANHLLIKKKTTLKKAGTIEFSDCGGKSGRTLAVQNQEQAERKRILTQIFKDGLNVNVSCSIFEEDKDLKMKFSSAAHRTRILYNTLNPVYNESFEQKVQMDTQIFEYLKNCRAVFEIRHYIIQSESQFNKQLPQSLLNSSRDNKGDTGRSIISENDEDTIEKCDYIVLGFVKIPLLNLITKNNGIEGDFYILDDYKQQMGQLKLKISLNHHNSQRPLYSGSNKLPNQVATTQDLNGFNNTIIDKTVKISNSLARGIQQQNEGSYILGVNFIELITKNREQLYLSSAVSKQMNAQSSYFYLKFRLQGQNFQTKFLSTSPSKMGTCDFFKQMQLRVFEIKRSVFVNINMSSQREIEEAFGKPMEIQLWYKKESIAKYNQPEQEELIGSFFLELNEVSKYKNRRVRESNGEFYAYEGYLSLYEFGSKEGVSRERLGIKVYLIKNDYESQQEDLEVLFHNLNSIENSISSKLDMQGKGYVDLEDLKSEAQNQIQEPYLTQLFKLIGNMEFKNQDKIFYSPLFSLPYPYFRYAQRFDSFGIIERFHKEFEALDQHDSGFISIGLFRSVLEHDLKIKEKIVGDFLLNLRDSLNSPQQTYQTLDVNVLTHSFRNHIDYVVLLRKLIMYHELKQKDKDDIQVEQEEALQSDHYLVFKLDIESGRRIKNPLTELEAPSTFVSWTVPFKDSNLENIETSVVKQSAYPQWHLSNVKVQFPLSQENIRQLTNFDYIELEVYHQGYNKDQFQNFLIGSVKVEFSQFSMENGVCKLSGYFDLQKASKMLDFDTIQAINPHRYTMESSGQIKINISCNQDIQKLISDSQNMMVLSGKQCPLVIQQDRTLNTQTHAKLMSSMKNISQHLGNEPEDELKYKHLNNMQALDDLTKKLQNTLNNQEMLPQHSEENKQMTIPGYIHDFTLTRGYSQSQNLKSQILGLQNDINNIIKNKNDHIQEIEEGSELDREENVFEQNMSESSQTKENKFIEEENRNMQSFQQSFNNNNNNQFNTTFNQNQQRKNLFMNLEADQQNEEEEEVKLRSSERARFIQVQSLDDNQPVQDINRNVFQESSHDVKNVFEQAHLGQANLGKKFSDINDRDEDDEDFDIKEMERVEKIMKRS